MIKRKAAYVLVGGLLVTGLVFNAPSMATYVQKFSATQTINAATWSVDFGHNLGTHTIFPGDTIGDDKITLTNGNNYPVKYTIKLSSTDNGLKEALTLDVKDAQGNSYGNTETTGEIKVQAGQIIILNSHVTWTKSQEENKDISYQGKSVQYHYDIVAEKAEVEAPETPEEPIVTVLESSAYEDGHVHLSFKLAKELNLSAGLFSKDNIIIEFIKEEVDENGEKVEKLIKRKDSSWRGYLNDEQGNKYPKLAGAEVEGDVKYFNILSPGIYSTSLNCDVKDIPNRINLKVKDDGEFIFNESFELN